MYEFVSQDEKIKGVCTLGICICLLPVSCHGNPLSAAYVLSCKGQVSYQAARSSCANAVTDCLGFLGMHQPCTSGKLEKIVFLPAFFLNTAWQMWCVQGKWDI